MKVEVCSGDIHIIVIIPQTVSFIEAKTVEGSETATCLVSAVDQHWGHRRSGRMSALMMPRSKSSPALSPEV